MAYSKTPSYLTRSGARFYLKLPIPPDLRHHFPGSTEGTTLTHIIEALNTSSEREAAERKKPRLSYWWQEFERLRRGVEGVPGSELKAAHQIREAMLEARAREDGDEGAAVEALESLAIDHAERIEQESNLEAARAFYDLATQPEKLTLLQAVGEMNSDPAGREGTKTKREHAVRELLRVLKVEDCLPEHVTDRKAVAYVQWLNEKATTPHGTPLGHSTKQDRLSNLSSLWKYLQRRRQVPRGVSLWADHELTRKKSSRSGVDGSKRGYRPEEVAAIMGAPEGPGSGHYTRSLMRQLYALGFITGMRLDELCSLRAQDLEAIPAKGRSKDPAGFWINVEAAKTDAGVRTIPVVHPVAVKILKGRLEDKKGEALLFDECRPGGPDGKQSWHVQKALGRFRDALGFGPEVDFHSTRRSWATMMENARVQPVWVQRYIGHRVPTLMHSVYSDGASRESLLEVARAVRYSGDMEAALKLAL